jgi:hypothetical protein
MLVSYDLGLHVTTQSYIVASEFVVRSVLGYHDDQSDQRLKNDDRRA